MKLDRYELSAGNALMVFEFTSEGPQGEILELIKFSETNLKGLYNLAVGDKLPGTERINDLAISNNGDSEKVLATIVSSVYAFTDKYPDALIYAVGSTKGRTRLYRMGITKYLTEVQEDFIVYGLCNNEWELFEKGTDYTAFLAELKK